MVKVHVACRNARWSSAFNNMHYYSLLRPLLFLLDAETAHHTAMRALAHPFWLPRYTPPSVLATRVWGLSFPSPIGLAAGFDKNARVLHAIQKAGFGFAEIGTLTPKPQAGNPRPRMFRIAEHESIINRLGFNNEGVHDAVPRLEKRPQGFLLGGNIGKNKESDDAIADYFTCMQNIYEHVDYITVNISSPNTPGLRTMQQGDTLNELIRILHNQRTDMVRKGALQKPILVKIAPDLSEPELEVIAGVALHHHIDGLIISNTTIARDAVKGAKHAGEQGGLSGKVLMQPSTKVLSRMYHLTNGRVPLIGVGGIASAEDAYAKILAGASLVQVYSALIYQGFGLVKTISEGLVPLLKRDGFAHVSDAVGKGVK